jgi:hypothetical protein
MANKIYCDRCEKELTDDKGHNEHASYIGVTLYKWPYKRGRGIASDNLDFCNYHCLAQWAFDKHNHPYGPVFPASEIDKAMGAHAER